MQGSDDVESYTIKFLKNLPEELCQPILTIENLFSFLNEDMLVGVNLLPILDFDNSEEEEKETESDKENIRDSRFLELLEELEPYSARLKSFELSESV